MARTRIKAIELLQNSTLELARNVRARWHALSMQIRLVFLIQGCLIIILSFVQYWITASFERQIMASAEAQALETANGVINGMNMLMLTKAIRNPKNRILLINKMADEKNIKHLHIIRSEQLTRQFGPGLADEQAVDEIEKGVLRTGKTYARQLEEKGELEQPTVLRVIVPFIASNDFRGTDCLSCHNTEAGNVIGAASMSYDLSSSQKELQKFSASLFIGHFILELLLFAIIWYLVRSFIFPIKSLTHRLNNIADGDIAGGRHLPIHFCDEIGQATHAFNRVIDAAHNLIDAQHLARSVFDNSSEGIVICDHNGNIVMANQAFAQTTGYSTEEVIGKNPRAILKSGRHDEKFYQVIWDSLMTTGQWRGEIWNKRKTGEVYPEWLTVNTVKNELEKISYFVSVSDDITEQKKHASRLAQLTNLYAALSYCNEAIVSCPNESELFQRICYATVHYGGMKMAWVGLADQENKTVKQVAAYGQGMDYLDGIEISINPDDPHSKGPSGSSIVEQQPYWCDDFMNDLRTTPWHKQATYFGWRSSAGLPIFRNGKAVGSLTLYSDIIGSLDNEARNLLTQIANNISFALDKFESEAKRKDSEDSLVESEQRFKTLVEQSIVGSFILQEERFTYLNPRFKEILGYAISDDILGHHLLEIVSPKDSELVNKNIHLLYEENACPKHFVFSAVCQDGSTTEVGVSLAMVTYCKHPAIIGLMQDISDRKIAEEQIKRHYDQLQTAFLQTVELATTLGEMRDPYTAGHERRVSSIAVAIGTEMGLNQFQLEGLRVGGYLHDVGKTIIPIEILTKPGRLTKFEYELIKAHPRAGFDVLKGVDFPWPVALIALQHHERMDGSGYPQGLKGEEIILEARIMAVADVVEAMGSHRPYRPGLGIEAALEEIKLGRGMRYDTHVADICLKLFNEGGYKLPS